MNSMDDNLIGMDVPSLTHAIRNHLRFGRAKTPDYALPVDAYHALSMAIRDRLVHRWIQTARAYSAEQAKRVYYLSAEYLLGRQLEANLLNLNLRAEAEAALKALGFSLDEVLEVEEDPGLGNGGLGRLAACFMDSLATLQLPAMGYGIRYEFGIFRQEIRNGRQIEHPDEWLRKGNPWEIQRPEYTVEVRFGGWVDQSVDDRGWLKMRWLGGETVLGLPYDTPVAGYGTNTVNTLRLWSARASEQFDLAVFNDGDFRRATEQKAISESISKILYPKDDSPEGKELRLRQQYFFVCCSIADMLRRFKRQYDDLSLLPEHVAIQLNDTHPAIAVAELMRVLVDVEGLAWDPAWELTQKTIAYTNHTLLPEALEKWSLPLFSRLLPRHTQIIFEIDRRFVRQIQLHDPQTPERIDRMRIVEAGEPRQIRMAHLSVVGSHHVNGVAQLHSQLLRERVLVDFAEMLPERFTNMTNGVTPRRWLLQCNPLLSKAITERIGDGWTTDLDQLSALADYASDSEFLGDLQRIKAANKQRWADWLQARTNQVVDPGMLFDVQIKRIHEYKRQLMACLHVIHLYNRLKFHGEDLIPRTVMIGGKAAPGYIRAKKTIKIISDVAATINADPICAGRLQLLFLPNYNVSMSEKIIPAADLSEQISMAGKEASGTGNMKFQMNGALTIGTLDGANVEIREAVGAENFFLFGHTTTEIQGILRSGYTPQTWIDQSPALDEAIKLLASGLFNPDEAALHADAARYIQQDDPYCICADFDGYVAMQQLAAETWTTPEKWWPMVAHNIAQSGRFSSDRTISEYASEIWGLKSVNVSLDS